MDQLLRKFFRHRGYSDKVINSGKFSLLPREQFMEYNTYIPEVYSETIFAIKRVVYYIPQDAINSYLGTLTQNPTQ